MTSRRRFVLKTSLAAAAMAAAKPMELMASVTKGFQRLAGNQKLVLLHTGKLSSSILNAPLGFVRKIAENKNVLLLNVSRKENADLNYDVVLQKMIDEKKDHLIVSSRGIRTGVLLALKGDTDIIANVERLSTWLKKEKDCQLVVCISDLGFSHQQTIDERKLAASTSMLDLIISTDPGNQLSQMLTVQNRISGEVIIQPSNNKIPIGAIELEFDAEGRKNRVSLVKDLPGSNAA